MSYARKETVSVTTDSGGAATAYSSALNGKISSIHYIADVSIAYANTVDFTITNETTSETIWSESNLSGSAVRRPRAATHGTDASASLFAASGTAVQDKIALADDRVKIVLAQGGNAKAGAFIIVLE